MTQDFLSRAGSVLAVFLIPFGGGIPAGVILAKNKELAWPVTAVVYLISDMILACAFEPLMHLFIRAMKHSIFLQRWLESYKQTLAKTGFKYGLAPSPLSLIVLSFGVDPMTGRAVAYAAGHGFVTGWALAICGDMIFFALIAASTLLLNNLLGDGTIAAAIIMVLMLFGPSVISRLKKQKI